MRWTLFCLSALAPDLRSVGGREGGLLLMRMKRQRHSGETRGVMFVVDPTTFLLRVFHLTNLRTVKKIPQVCRPEKCQGRTVEYNEATEFQ